MEFLSSFFQAPADPALEKKSADEQKEKEAMSKIFVTLFSGDEKKILDMFSKKTPQGKEFFDEFFTLEFRPYMVVNHILRKPESELLSMSTVFNILFQQCSAYLQKESKIMKVHALELLCVLFSSIFRKKWSNFNIDTITMFCGFNQSDSFFKQLIETICQLLHYPSIQIQQLCLVLLVIILTGNESLNNNAILDYFNLIDIFSYLLTIIHAKIDNASKTKKSKNSPKGQIMTLKMKKNALICLGILSNFRKFDANSNVYRNHLLSHNLESPEILIDFSNVISQSLWKWNKNAEKNIDNLHIATKPTFGLVSWITNLFEHETFVPVRGDLKNVSMALLLFYELAHMNKNFVGSLTRSLAWMAAVEKKKKVKLMAKTGINLDSTSANYFIEVDPESAMKLNSLIEEESESSKLDAEFKTSTPSTTTPTTPQGYTMGRQHELACPLILQEFLKFLSIIFQEKEFDDVSLIAQYKNNMPPADLMNPPQRTPKQIEETKTIVAEELNLKDSYVHLSFLILKCLLEHKVFREFLFDINTQLDFFIFEREDEQSFKFSRKSFIGTGTLARAFFIILLNYFHLNCSKKRLDLENLDLCLGIIHSLILLSKRNRIRLMLDWNRLWSDLITCLEVVISKPNVLVAHKDAVVSLVRSILVMINLTIATGELFLPKRDFFDNLLLELVKRKFVFDEFDDWLKRNFTSRAEVTNPFKLFRIRIKDIIDDIDMLLMAQKVPGFSAEDKGGFIEGVEPPSNIASSLINTLTTSQSSESAQVLKLIRDAINPKDYVKLPNKEEDKKFWSEIEAYTPYLENPNQVKFFNVLLRLFVKQTKLSASQSFM